MDLFAFNAYSELITFFVIALAGLTYTLAFRAYNVALINLSQASVDAARAFAIVDAIERGEAVDIQNLIELPYLECLTDFKYWWPAVDDYERWAQDVIMSCSARHMTLLPLDAENDN